MKIHYRFRYTFLLIILSGLLNAQSPEISNPRFLDAGARGLRFEGLEELDAMGMTPIEEDNTYLGFTDHQYWLRFDLSNQSESDGLYYLRAARSVTDSAALYFEEEGLLKTLFSGDQMAFKDRAVPNRETIFPIELRAGESKSYALMLRSDGETLDLGLDVMTSEEFMAMNYRQQLFLGLFYGVLIISTLIYLFFYSSLRENAFLFYSFYVASIAFLQGSLDGLIYQYFLPNGGYFNARFVLISAAFSNFFLLKYAASFLKVSKQSPRLYTFYRVFYWVIPSIAALVFVSPELMATVYPLSNVNGLLSLILILCSVFYIHLKVQKVDPFFLIGIFFLVIGLLGFVMNNLSLLPTNFWILNSAKFGISFEVIFLSLSMTNLIGKLRKAKERSQAEALKKAQEISAYKTYFMSNISHELRTPINAILGLASEQLENSTDEKANENYRLIKSASFSLLSNVNDILDFEQIEKDKLELEMDQSFNPYELMEDLCQSWAYEAKRNDIGFAWNIGTQLPRALKGDERRFRQIVNNLISNAVKFTDSGQVQVNLHGEIGDDAKVRLKLSVVDSGIGMDKDQQESVFESFNQMKLNNKRRYGGLGLGLTIVRHLVKLFDAQLKVESELGLGTTVRMWLQLEAETPVIESAETKEEITNSGVLRVLVAEDNMMNQLIMKKLLGDQDQFQLDIAGDGKIALEKLQSGSYDLVLMDLQMPNMDGYECCTAIREGQAGSHHQEIPIIAVTADALQETRKRALDLGMNAFLTKPVRKEQLLKTIYSFCGKANRIAV